MLSGHQIEKIMGNYAGEETQVFVGVQGKRDQKKPQPHFDEKDRLVS